MPLRPLLLSVLPALAACSSPAEVREKTGVQAQAQGSGSRASAAASSSSSARGGARQVAEDTDLYSYEFSYPAAVGAHPALVARLEKAAREAKAEMIAQAKEGQADAKANNYPMNPYSYGAEWKVVADLPGYLSLSNEFHTYSGGAHGMYGVEGLVWDKARQQAVGSAALFTSPGDLADALDKRLCDALNQERAERRGEPVNPADDVFGDCPSLDEATILVGSAGKRVFDRITVYFGPYVAGSYAEGAYELDFPMDAAMLKTVKPAYRAAFGMRAQS